MPAPFFLRRILFWGMGLIVLLLLTGVGIGSSFSRTFYPSPPPANFPAAEDLRTAQLQDLEYFEHYLTLDRSYTPETLVQAQELLTTFREEAGRLSPAAFDLAISRIVALADNGHSQLFPSLLAERHNRIPCTLYRFGDGIYIVRARPTCLDLLGGRILAINGRGIEGIVEEMYTYVGGPRNRYEHLTSPLFLESPALLHAAGMGHDPDRIRLRVLLEDGSQIEAEVEADPADSQRPRRIGLDALSPERIEGEAEDWLPLLSIEGEIPYYLRERATPFRSTYLEEERIYIAQFRTNTDALGFPIRTFVSQIREEVREDTPHTIVLDLRFNSGGDFTTTASLMKDITQLANSVERVFILTSAWTFSAGITNVALAKEHGGDRVTLVGEPVGDRIRFWGEGGRLQLPNSELALRFSTGLHDYSESCLGEPGCFWTLFLHPMEVESLDPEVAVSHTFQDYFRMRDPALERVIELMKE